MSIACYLGLGSNLRSPQRQLRQAIQSLRSLPQSALIKHSTLFFNPAVGLKAQPPFYNAVVLLNTTLKPTELLRHCQMIEHRQGRVRKKRWGARTLDIDILLYGNYQCNTPTLTLPHPLLMQRPFVLEPLQEIAPGKKKPVK